MAVLAYPALQSESWSLSGTGSLLFTRAQRQARTLSVAIEKVRSPGNTEYYNFRYPEPASFWGYIQPMVGDFVSSSRQLNFRREVLRIDSQLSPIETEQLRCLIKNSTEFLYQSIEPLLLAAGSDAEELGAGLANYRLSAAQEMVVPIRPETALWYEIIPGYTGFITLSWGEYPSPCENLLGTKIAPQAVSPGKGESANGGAGNSGGGGFRPPQNPPPDRTSDPNSDSPIPPPDNGGGPESPEEGPFIPPPGNYLFNVSWIPGGRDEVGGPCRSVIREATYVLIGGSGPGQVISLVGPGDRIEYQVAGRDGVAIASLTSGAAAGPCPPRMVSAENIPYEP